MRACRQTHSEAFYVTTADEHHSAVCTYHYDPLDRLVSAASSQLNRLSFYQKSRLATEIQGNLSHTLFQHESLLLGQRQQHLAHSSTTLLATDTQRSVLHTVSAPQHVAQAYTPYGHRSAQHPLTSVLGFSGERADPVTGHFLLGNGYRAFNPVLMRFNSPDSWSPFGEGGVNAYAAFKGNPIGQIDPTGHFPIPTSTRWINKLAFSQRAGTSLRGDISQRILRERTVSRTAAQVERSAETAALSHFQNNKPQLLEFETGMSQWAQKNGTGSTRLVHQASDLSVVAPPGGTKTKFVFMEKSGLAIGSLHEAVPTKYISHATLANQFEGERVLSAGYMSRVDDRLMIVNQSGHYRPSFESLTPVKRYLEGLGLKVSSVRREDKKLVKGRTLYTQ